MNPSVTNYVHPWVTSNDHNAPGRVRREVFSRDVILPGRRSPPATASKILLRASPGERGWAALEMTLSQINSIGCWEGSIYIFSLHTQLVFINGKDWFSTQTNLNLWSLMEYSGGKRCNTYLQEKNFYAVNLKTPSKISLPKLDI